MPADASLGLRFLSRDYPVLLAQLSCLPHLLAEEATREQAVAMTARIVVQADRYNAHQALGLGRAGLVHPADLADVLRAVDLAEAAVRPTEEAVISLWYNALLEGFVGLVCEPGEAVRRMLVASGMAQDFAYRTAGGRPAAVSAVEWSLRARVWEELRWDNAAHPIFRVRLVPPTVATRRAALFTGGPISEKSRLRMVQPLVLAGLRTAEGTVGDAADLQSRLRRSLVPWSTLKAQCGFAESPRAQESDLANA